MDEDFFDSQRKLIAVSVTLLGAVPVAVNIWALLTWEPLQFQRLGSIWVALAIVAFGFTKMVAADIVAAIEGHGPMATEADEKLGPFLFDERKGWLNYMNEKGEQYDRPLVKKSELVRQLRDLLAYARHRAYGTELGLGFFGTLQWGYGDMLACAARGKGWTTC